MLIFVPFPEPNFFIKWCALDETKDINPVPNEYG